jgi:hypothetical protein
MNRPVFALFATRAEAEAARARLASDVKVDWTRTLAKDTAAALGNFKLDAKLAKSYQQALQRGDHLLVAKVARGEDPKRIVRALADPIAPELSQVEPLQSYSIEDPNSPPAPAEPEPIVDEDPDDTVRVVETPPPVAGEAASKPEPQSAAEPQPEPGEQLRIGEPKVVSGRGGSEPIPAATGSGTASGRRISYEEVEALGLLQDRTIEVVEMREEPVIAKEVVVREEVIVRKTVSERTETIRDSLRRTQVEVEELPAGDRR